MTEIINDENLAENPWDYEEEIHTYLYWLNIDRFDRREANRRLREEFPQEKSVLQSGVASLSEEVS